MLIVFEGIDGCGKTTLSKKLAQILGFKWTREPTFSSEEADALNLKSKNDIQREIEFAIDRIKHINDFLNLPQKVVCDRYIWTGLAYCKTYNPAAFPFADALYKHSYFKKPDFYVFVDTPVEICFERRKVQPIEHLIKIREAYLNTRDIVETTSKIITVQGVGDIEEGIREILKKIKVSHL